MGYELILDTSSKQLAIGIYKDDELLYKNQYYAWLRQSEMAIPEIEKAINKSDIGISPQNDGKVIRLNFPPLTEERRKELVKTVKKYSEEAKIQIRNARRDAMDDYKKKQKASEITEDDLKGIEKDIQNLTDKYIKEIDDITTEKEKEILEV